MPNDKKAIHPSGLEITFREEDHSYTDGMGRDYMSVTTLIKSAFEAFDGPKIAAAKSAKTGVPASQYLAEWDANREMAADNGTRLHENCERQILGQYELMHQPKDQEERLQFRAAWNEVEKIKSNLSNLQPELIVFSPQFRVAGSIDLLAMRSQNNYRIFDWKRIRELKREGFRGKTGHIFPTLMVPDCNFYHYALQLSIYELIMKMEGYMPPGAEVQRWLIPYINREFQYERLPDMDREAALLLAWHVSGGLDEVPF